jgi:hypothetical protein
LLHFRSKISDLHAICGMAELKSQIWEAKIVNLHGICSILASTHLPVVFNGVWMVSIDFLMVLNGFSMVSKIFVHVFFANPLSRMTVRILTML